MCEKSCMPFLEGCKLQVVQNNLVKTIMVVHCKYTGYTQKNGAVSIVFTIETAPIFLCMSCTYGKL
jgi:hypothetical protein